MDFGIPGGPGTNYPQVRRDGYIPFQRISLWLEKTLLGMIQWDASQSFSKTAPNGHQKHQWGPGTVAHAYNLSTLEAKVDGSLEVRSSRPAWPTW